MKKGIKITLIAIVAIGIIATIAIFTSNITSGPNDKIVVGDFKNHIQERVDNEIKGKEFHAAQAGYQSIMAEINTEASIILGNGLRNLSVEDEKACKQAAFYEYAPIFADYGTNYFTRSSWDESTINTLKSEATELLGMSIAEAKTDVDKDLKAIINNVNDYYAAWKVANSASRCTSVSTIPSYKSQASKYLHSPLTNNASLSSALKNVEQQAKNSVVRIIAGSCNSVAHNYAHYGSYTAFYSAYNNALSRINDYKSKYGMPAALSQAKSNMDSADEKALNYYSSYVN